MTIDSRNLTNLNALIRREVNRAVESIFESKLTPDDDERRRQDTISKAITNRKLRAEDEKESVEEAEESKDSEEPKEEPKEKEEKPKKREDRTGGKGTADSEKAATPDASTLRKPSLGNFIDKLNILRGGKSLKDPDVKRSFDQYLGTLNVKEKQTMLVFLTAISQILVGKKTGANALDPSEVGLRIKSPEKPTSDPKTDSSTGTEQAPIVVGESQDKNAIKKMIKAYRSFE